MPKRKQRAPPARQASGEEHDGEEPVGVGGEDELSRGDEPSSSSEPSTSSEEEEEESEDDEDGARFERVEVDFEFHDPAEADFQGLRVLMTTLLDGKQWDASGMAAAVVQQRARGHVGPAAMLTVWHRRSVLGLRTHKGQRPSC